jgi:hypothetical protein
VLPDNAFGRLPDGCSGSIETSTATTVGAGSGYGYGYATGLSASNQPMPATWARADTPTVIDGLFTWRPLHLGHVVPIAATSGALAKRFDINAFIFYRITIINEC